MVVDDVVKKIDELITRYNEEEPKRRDADPTKLLLVDNRITLTVKHHLGNIYAVIIEGPWGIGKTHSALKLFHENKGKMYVTYIPVRAVIDSIRERRVRLSSNRESVLATLIIEALYNPTSLSLRASKQGTDPVLTNAPDIEIDEKSTMFRELIEGYYRELSKRGESHLLILDELEAAIKSEVDVDALAELLGILRDLFDKYGATRLTIVTLLVPHVQLPGAVGGSVVDLLESRMAKELYYKQYIRDKAVIKKLNEEEIIDITKSTLLGLGKMIFEILNKEFDVNIKFEESELKRSVDLITQITHRVRIGRDLLKGVIVEAVQQHLRGETIDLVKITESVIARVLGFRDSEEVFDTLVRGKLGSLDYELKHVESILNSKVLQRLKEMGLIDTYYKVEERSERGFKSITYMLKRKVRQQKQKGEQTTPIDYSVTFWLRFSDTNQKAVKKANNIFAGRLVYLITLEGSKHGSLTLAGNFKLAGILYLRPEVVYYLIARDRIQDEKILYDLELMFENSYAVNIIEGLRTYLMD